MKPITSHITYLGKPACESQYPAAPVYMVQCEYESLADARRAARSCRHYAVKAIKGCCPSFNKEEA
jgi:hypothetical protein